jgi:prolyl-tRNA synthetase
MFSKFSHEFQTVTSTGEDTIYVDENKGIAINKEVYNDEVLASLGINKEDLVENKAVEVGNIFTLGTRFSDALNLKYKNEEGEEKSVFMGSYGIGPGRLMGTIVEVLSDDKGIIWPESVAPFQVHLLVLGDDDNVRKEANLLYEKLIEKGIEVLLDDRDDISAGEKFADSDLIGIPFRVVVSKRSLADLPDGKAGGGFEVKKRTESSGKIVSFDELINFLNV